MARGKNTEEATSSTRDRTHKYYWLDGRAMVAVAVKPLKVKECSHEHRQKVGVSESRTDYDADVKWFCGDCLSEWSDYGPFPTSVRRERLRDRPAPVDPNIYRR
jgi:hypothetical protein